jgi:hypothetical protein
VFILSIHTFVVTAEIPKAWTRPSILITTIFPGLLSEWMQNPVQNPEGSDSLEAFRMAMPHGGVRDLAYHYSISEQLLCGSIYASGALSQTLVDRVRRENICHIFSGLKPRSKRIQGDPRKSTLEILTMCPHYPSHSLEGYS